MEEKREEKKIDNNIKTTKQIINEIDNKLSVEKKKIKKLDEMQETLYELNKNMTKCIELLSKSIKGPTTNNIFSDMENKNRIFYIKGSSVLDEETELSMKKIQNLYKEKSNEIAKSKKEQEKE